MRYITTDELSDSHAFYHLGMAYKTGTPTGTPNDIPCDHRESERLLRLASSLGHIGAKLVLAREYLHGINVELDTAEAAHQYYQAASLGNAEAAFELGCFYITGIGVTISLANALYWWKSSSYKKNKKAHETLLLFYKWTNDISSLFDMGFTYKCMNLREFAIKFLRASADLGHAESYYELGILLSGGSAIEREEGIRWLHKASGNESGEWNEDLSDVESTDTYS